MIRVDIETIIMASGAVPCVIVLRERGTNDSVPARALSIQTGPFEAASIGRGIDGDRGDTRPITHDLFTDTLQQLGAKLERIEIDRVKGPVFFARIVLATSGENAQEISVDARPSDAIALAVRANAPIYVEDDVMNLAGSTSRRETDAVNEQELEEFDQFVQSLSPDDF